MRLTLVQTAAKPSSWTWSWFEGRSRLRQETVEKSRRVCDRHGAIVGDRQELISGHGHSVSVSVVTEGADREAEEVQLLISQTFSEDVFISERAQLGSAVRWGSLSHPWSSVQMSPLKV